jgi:hypothetical protein
LFLGLNNAADFRQALDALMSVMPVEVMDLPLMYGSALCEVVAGDSVGPLAKRRFDESFGFGYGPRAIGSVEAVLDSEIAVRSGEERGAER